MKIQEMLYPTCNLNTVRDGRGGIFTWIPKDPIVEFNMLYFQPGKTRGDHAHPEFDEYFLIVDGAGAMVSRDLYEQEEMDKIVEYDEKGEPWKNTEKYSKNQRIIHMSKGSCIRNPAGVPHTFYAITAVTAIAMLTKKWDDCKPPIVQLVC